MLNIFYLTTFCAGKFLPNSLIGVKRARRTQGQAAEEGDATKAGCAGEGEAARVLDWKHRLVRPKTAASLPGNYGDRVGLGWICGRGCKSSVEGENNPLASVEQV